MSFLKTARSLNSLTPKKNYHIWLYLTQLYHNLTWIWIAWKLFACPLLTYIVILRTDLLLFWERTVSKTGHFDTGRLKTGRFENGPFWVGTYESFRERPFWKWPVSRTGFFDNVLERVVLIIGRFENGHFWARWTFFVRNFKVPLGFSLQQKTAIFYL